MQIPEKTTAWFLLAKTYDRAKAYDEAWAAAEAAHEPYRGWDCNRAVEELQNLQSFFSRDLVQALTRSDKTFEWKPLYIVGMPRSGTTLLEQILSMHGSVSNGGEMSVSLRMLQTLPKITDSYHQFPNCVLDMQTSDANALGDMYMDACRPFAAGTAMASNKALNLQAHLGFLSRVVPDARAIMLYRHPLDNAVSCHTNNLVTLGHRFTTDLRHFGKIWVARRKLQEHWLEVLDMPMLELHYEQMVRNQDEETRRLIDFLELDWDAKCLDFHESTNVARTISWDQVNKKMYNTSDGRWKHYEKHLGPAIEELGEYL
jgi:hypothetical protein